MTGLWGIVDAAIGLFSFSLPMSDIYLLSKILIVNAGLDILYVITGVFLFTRSRILLRGYGLAILIQGVFLLLFDFSFWLRCGLKMNSR